MFWWILENTLIAAVLALFVALVCRAKRVPPVVRHGLWLVVLIRLIAPPVFSVSLPFPAKWRDFGDSHRLEKTTENVFPDRVWPDPPTLLPEEPGLASGAGTVAEVEVPIAATAEVVEFPTNVESSPDPERPAPEISLRSAAIPVHAVAPVQNPPGMLDLSQGGQSAVEIQWPILTLLVWGAMAGILLAVVVQFVRITRMRRVLNRSRPATAEIVSVVRDLAVRMNVRAPPVRLSSDIQAPLVCSLGRTVLLWPEMRVTDFPEPGRQAVIVHELAHLARRDHWIGWLELVAACLWWWNPLFWYVRHQLHENAELACDAWVTGLLPEGRRAYARALVDLAEFDSMKRGAAAALGIGDGSRKLFERRLVMIMGEGVRYRLGASGLIGVGLLALAALPGCTAGQAADEPFAVASEATATESSAPPVLLPGSADPKPNIIEDPISQGPEAVPELAPPSTVPLTPPTRVDPAIDAGADPLVPAVEHSPKSSGPNAAAVSPEERIKRLEDRFDAILAELRELKNPGVGKFKSPPREVVDPKSPKTTVKQNLFYETTKAKPQPQSADADPHASRPEKLGGLKKLPRAEGEPEAVTLTRTSYKLPPGRAQGVAAFLTQNLDDEIEIRVKGDALQVTATAEDQAAIAQLVRLLQTRGAVEPKPSTPHLKSSKRAAPNPSEEVGDVPEAGSVRKF